MNTHKVSLTLVTLSLLAAGGCGLFRLGEADFDRSASLEWSGGQSTATPIATGATATLVMRWGDSAQLATSDEPDGLEVLVQRGDVLVRAHRAGIYEVTVETADDVVTETLVVADPDAIELNASHRGWFTWDGPMPGAVLVGEDVLLVARGLAGGEELVGVDYLSVTAEGGAGLRNEGEEVEIAHLVDENRFRVLAREPGVALLTVHAADLEQRFELPLVSPSEVTRVEVTGRQTTGRDIHLAIFEARVFVGDAELDHASCGWEFVPERGRVLTDVLAPMQATVEVSDAGGLTALCRVGETIGEASIELE